MADLSHPNILHHDHWIEHGQGRLFARSWTPPTVSADVPIVLFHDSLGCVELWRDFPLQLSAVTGRKVIAYDRLGFGRSDERVGQPALDFIADEVASYFPAVRARLGITRFIALGHSVGGCMAINVAAELAGDCVALITESAQCFPEELTLRNIAAAREQFKDPGQVQRLQKYHGDKARWVLDAWTESWLHPDFAAWSLETVLPRISCPVLAIHGTQDEYGTTLHPQMIGRLCSGPTRVELIPDTFHVPHRERPEDIVQLIADFVAAPRQA